MPPFISLSLIFVLGISLVYMVYKAGRWKRPTGNDFNPDWRKFLEENIDFYQKLDNTGRKRFEYKISEFLGNVMITGIKTDVQDTDRLLVAASAVIPIFNFPKWQYKNLKEVLLYPSHFGYNFALEGDDRSVLGMVGNGYMEGKMILSRPSLIHGFKNEKDKNNTAIHEFIHLIDKADGVIDGIPSLLLEKQYVIPWLQLMEAEIKKIHEGKSDLKPYGGTNRMEFFAVLGEYFFEHPQQLEKKHPELFDLLTRIFDTESKA
ncbi:MAG: zinc-dependent peptidase [Bacteroidetes bacterium]|nr:zinc-dependent peptidase [Bacteroidota bacterium]